MDTAVTTTPAHVGRNEWLATIREFTLGRIAFDAATLAINYTCGLTVVKVEGGRTLLVRRDRDSIDRLVAVREADGAIRTSGLPMAITEKDIAVVHQNARGAGIPYACSWAPIISEAHR